MYAQLDCCLSRVPIPIHIDTAYPETEVTPDLVEASVSLVVVLYHIAVSTITEGSVRRVFAITKLVVPTLTHVETHGSASSHSSVTGSVAAGTYETQPTGTPVVYFALLQVGIVREPTQLSNCLPEVSGIDGGRYLPSLQGMLSGMGMVLYAGKSVISSGEGARLLSEGLSICGGGMRGSLRCASPSMRMELTRLQLAAFLSIDAISDNTISNQNNINCCN